MVEGGRAELAGQPLDDRKLAALAHTRKEVWRTRREFLCLRVGGSPYPSQCGLVAAHRRAEHQAVGPAFPECRRGFPQPFQHGDMAAVGDVAEDLPPNAGARVPEPLGSGQLARDARDGKRVGGRVAALLGDGYPSKVEQPGDDLRATRSGRLGQHIFPRVPGPLPHVSTGHNPSGCAQVAGEAGCVDGHEQGIHQAAFLEAEPPNPREDGHRATAGRGHERTGPCLRLGPSAAEPPKVPGKANTRIAGGAGGAHALPDCAVVVAAAVLRPQRPREPEEPPGSHQLRGFRELASVERRPEGSAANEPGHVLAPAVAGRAQTFAENSAAIVAPSLQPQAAEGGNSTGLALVARARERVRERPGHVGPD